MKEPKPDPEEVAHIRELLKQWDEGMITLGEFEANINRPFKDTVFDLMRAGKDYGEFTIGCFNEKVKPTVSIDVELKLFPGGFHMTPKGITQRKTFMDLAVAGKLDDIETAILDAVDAWHVYEPTIPEDIVGESLQTWLGMMWYEYARWVQHPNELKDIIKGRQNES